jgi:hypothetical protein
VLLENVFWQDGKEKAEKIYNYCSIFKRRKNMGQMAK